jgi:hypothetical protein
MPFAATPRDPATRGKAVRRPDPAVHKRLAKADHLAEKIGLSQPLTDPWRILGAADPPERTG